MSCPQQKDSVRIRDMHRELTGEDINPSAWHDHQTGEGKGNRVVPADEAAAAARRMCMDAGVADPDSDPRTKDFMAAIGSGDIRVTPKRAWAMTNAKTIREGTVANKPAAVIRSTVTPSGTSEYAEIDEQIYAAARTFSTSDLLGVTEGRSYTRTWNAITADQEGYDAYVSENNEFLATNQEVAAIVRDQLRAKVRETGTVDMQDPSLRMLAAARAQHRARVQESDTINYWREEHSREQKRIGAMSDTEVMDVLADSDNMPEAMLVRQEEEEHRTGGNVSKRFRDHQQHERFLWDIRGDVAIKEAEKRGLF